MKWVRCCRRGTWSQECVSQEGFRKLELHMPRSDGEILAAQLNSRTAGTSLERGAHDVYRQLGYSVKMSSSRAINNPPAPMTLKVKLHPVMQS